VLRKQHQLEKLRGDSARNPIFPGGRRVPNAIQHPDTRLVERKKNWANTKEKREKKIGLQNQKPKQRAPHETLKKKKDGGLGTWLEKIWGEKKGSQGLLPKRPVRGGKGKGQVCPS